MRSVVIQHRVGESLKSDADAMVAKQRKKFLICSLLELEQEAEFDDRSDWRRDLMERGDDSGGVYGVASRVSRTGDDNLKGIKFHI